MSEGEKDQELSAEEKERYRKKREKTREHYRLHWIVLDPDCEAGGTYGEHREGMCGCGGGKDR